MSALRSVADWFADVQGFWLSAFVIVAWAIETSAHNPTVLLPYDRCVINAGMAIGILRLVYVGVHARDAQ